MKLVICTNTETLRPIWGDIYDDAEWYDTHDWDEAIAVHWFNVFSQAVLGTVPYQYESAFQYWHGGPGRGSWVLWDNARPVATRVIDGPEYDAIAAACALADAAAREAAQQDVAALRATLRAEAGGGQ